MLQSDYNKSEKVLSCAFDGHLDTNSCILINNELNANIDIIKSADETAALSETKIIFDMKGVSYIASSFIRICVSTARQLPKGHFSMINCDPFIKKTFIIAGLDELLKVN
ncbi:MAG: STAS domain-containing protein [Bacteroidales bacterium]|nr:STAS domain-containing protein [Bacteroidales bacterium]